MFSVDEEEVDDLAPGLELASHFPSDDAANAGTQQKVRTIGLTCAHRRGQAAGHGLNPQVLWRICWDRWIAVKGKDGSTWIGLACQFGQRVQGTNATPPAGHSEDWPQSAALLEAG